MWYVYSDYELGQGDVFFDTAATARAWLIKQFSEDNYWKETEFVDAGYFEFLKDTKQSQSVDSFVDYLLDLGISGIEKCTVITMEDVLYYK